MSDRSMAQSRPGGETRGTQQPKGATSTTTNVPNAVQGFSKNRNQPIQIEASALEVQDKTKVATFRGKVHVKQGDTELRCNVLVVYYEAEDAGTTSGVRSGPPTADGQRIRRLEAKGNVIVTQKEQTATGEAGDFDMRKNTITLRGNVVVSQGRNVLRGDRLVVDMGTAVSRMESDGGRVQGLFQPSTREGDSGRDGSPAVPRLR
ncbi:MAG: LPS ABC transporter substrate-binding protein LptA [Rhizobiales bacterium]|nr:LPS ABC transporter substrate-binding protein LptA [Hyphomicrobiales bacterium]